jgi:hypothetical protein
MSEPNWEPIETLLNPPPTLKPVDDTWWRWIIRGALLTIGAVCAAPIAAVVLLFWRGFLGG